MGELKEPFKSGSLNFSCLYSEKTTKWLEVEPPEARRSSAASWRRVTAAAATAATAAKAAKAATAAASALPPPSCDVVRKDTLSC